MFARKTLAIAIAVVLAVSTLAVSNVSARQEGSIYPIVHTQGGVPYVSAAPSCGNVGSNDLITTLDSENVTSTSTNFGIGNLFAKPVSASLVTAWERLRSHVDYLGSGGWPEIVSRPEQVFSNPYLEVVTEVVFQPFQPVVSVRSPVFELLPPETFPGGLPIQFQLDIVARLNYRTGVITQNERPRVLMVCVVGPPQPDPYIRFP